MSAVRLVIEGVAGLLQGERRALEPGQEILVGRSRSCGLSVASTPAAHAIGRDALLRSPAFQKLSRKHVRLVFHEDGKTVEIEDLSTNGIVLDGRQVNRTSYPLDRIRRNAVIVRFGDGEKLRLRLDAPAAGSGHSLSSG